MFPVKRELQDNTQNLDLNTTARKGERGIEKFSPYLINATYAILTAELAFPIGSFNEENELKKLQGVKEGESSVPDTISQAPAQSLKGPNPSVIGGKSMATMGTAAGNASQATL